MFHTYEPLLDADWGAQNGLYIQMTPQNTPVPEDLFIHCLSFLSGKDKATAAKVCRQWRSIAYVPDLWPKLNLSNYVHGVHDALLEHILENNKPRFNNITELNLEGCTALTYRCLPMITNNCPNLEVLLLTGCKRIHPDHIVVAVSKLQFLRKLELYKVTDDFSIIDRILAARPWIDLGFFWLEYLSHSGKTDSRMILEGDRGARFIRGRDRPYYEEVSDEEPPEYGIAVLDDSDDELKKRNKHLVPPPLQDPPCRWAGGFNDGACFGRVCGRVLMSNQHYPAGGNYPHEVRFACQQHKDNDLNDDELHKCESCEEFFKQRSMVSSLCCKVCYDSKKLHEKGIWIRLTTKEIRAFDFGKVCHSTVRMADWRNLPPRLTNIGEVTATLNYAPENEDEDFDDLEQVSQREFWFQNRERVDQVLHDFKRLLRLAQRRQNTRALLVYHPQNRDTICVMADRGLLFHGPNGQDFVNLTISAWIKFLAITLPVLVVSTLTIFLCWHMEWFKEKFPPFESRPIIMKNKPMKSQNAAFLIMAVAVFIAVFFAFFILYRFRRQCERVFRAFLVADIFVLMAMGGFVLTIIPLHNYNAATGMFTMCVGFYNFGIVGLLTLYYRTPTYLHCAFLVALFSIMSVLITSMLQQYVALFIALLAIADTVAMFRPQFANMFTPFIIPTNLPLPPTTPKIFYEVDGLRLRAFDFMFYGMLPGVASYVFVNQFLVVSSILFGYIACVFVLPFFSWQVRPLPLTFILVLFTALMATQFVNPFLEDSYAKWYFQAP